jgi:hypothetical protein
MAVPPPHQGHPIILQIVPGENPYDRARHPQRRSTSNGRRLSYSCDDQQLSPGPKSYVEVASSALLTRRHSGGYATTYQRRLYDPHGTMSGRVSIPLNRSIPHPLIPSHTFNVPVRRRSSQRFTVCVGFQWFSRIISARDRIGTRVSRTQFPVW